MVQNFVDILLDLLHNVTILRGKGEMVSINRKLFETHPMKLSSTHIAGIPLTTFMDTKTGDVAKSQYFQYNSVKSDDDNLVFLDITVGKRAYSNGADIIAYNLNEKGDVEETVVDSIIIKE